MSYWKLFIYFLFILEVGGMIIKFLFLVLKVFIISLRFEEGFEV